jgi:hypothetical protein
VEELSRWCGNCGTELRSGAQFCSRCGQRVIGEEPAAGSSGAGSGSAPVEGGGPGFTEAGSRLAAAAPGSGLDGLFSAPPAAPERPPDENWSDWYADTAPRSPFEPLVSRPPAGPPPAQPPPTYQQPVYQPPVYQQPVYQQPVYQQPAPPAPAPFNPQPQRSPYEPPPGGPPGPRRRSSRAPLFWSALSVAVVAAVVAFLFLVHPFNHHESVNDAANSTGTTAPASAASTSSAAASAPATVPASSSASAASASASASASVSSTAVTEQQAASTVAGMLASSVADRTAIDTAYNDVDSCGPNLDSDAAVFTRAASSRSALLASLAAMPGRSALPPALLSDLASAWQASISADQGFATWANDEASQGCVADDTSDPGYQATVTPDNEATRYKTAFVTQWNPLATSYGLTTYQQNQL